MDSQRTMYLFMNMCFVHFQNDLASCGYQASWKQIIIAVTLIDVFFQSCFLLRCFLSAPSTHRRPTLCLKERYFFPFSERNKIVRKLINLFRKNLIISKVKCIICQCLPGKMADVRLITALISRDFHKYQSSSCRHAFVHGSRQSVTYRVIKTHISSLTT